MFQGVTAFALDKDYVARMERREHDHQGTEDLSVVNEFLEVCLDFLPHVSQFSYHLLYPEANLIGTFFCIHDAYKLSATSC